MRKKNDLRFAKALQQAREKAGLSQWKLAKISGVSRPTVCRLEKGERHPSRAMVLRLGQALGLTPYQFLEFGRAAGFWFSLDELSRLDRKGA